MLAAPGLHTRAQVPSPLFFSPAVPPPPSTPCGPSNPVSPHTLALRHVLHLSGLSLPLRTARYWPPPPPKCNPVQPSATQCLVGRFRHPGLLAAWLLLRCCCWLRNDGIDDMDLTDLTHHHVRVHHHLHLHHTSISSSRSPPHLRSAS
ncbi:hypothetical protein L207DRAFT_84811 [Hyaloscypha variabilis F]|uniref:Uncharacterized protein n=1 Tax=Hyaloscypha variabilis (strain UAMH 11265 / GT02V1 / F) TaxID=1149755 RepID=A0A2J6RDH3_HYAVF|nr:hypothetical protein L207DRAFT_84811 [Hyaloscypha variabilis F]